MQLTKDEIDAIVYQCRQQGDDSTYAVVTAAIAAHTAKVLEGVEPVGWMGVSGVGERIVSRAQIYPFMTIPLYPAHTVAALKSERDALTTALAACRDSFPAPSPGSASENAWAAAIADPGSVPAYVAARVAELEKDAGRYRWLRDGEVSADYPYPVMRTGGIGLGDRTIWAEELDDAIDVALAAKGQA